MCLNLWERYNEALYRYLAVANALVNVEYGSEFDLAYDRTTRARLEFEGISELYRRHTREHGCDWPGP